jgi:hypothetical protein
MNNYNRILLQVWEANVDIQMVHDAYACARYCVGYLFKAEGGVSKLLRAANDEAKRGNTSFKEKITKDAHILLNGTHVSAQESAAFCLQIPYTSCSRLECFINTSPPSQRIRILKSKADLEKLAVSEPESNDVFSEGVIEKYSARPSELEALTLADFATLYDYKTSKPSGK